MKSIQPEVVTYTCDGGCGKQQQAPFDCTITIKQVGRDFQGQAVGATNTERDLCFSCKDRLNEFFKGRDTKESDLNYQITAVINEMRAIANLEAARNNDNPNYKGQSKQEDQYVWKLADRLTAILEVRDE